MQQEKGITPFMTPGHKDAVYHVGYLYSALWGALSKYDELKACSYFSSNGQEVEYVVESDGTILYTEEKMFGNNSKVSDYLKPQTAKTVITSDGSYLPTKDKSAAGYAENNFYYEGRQAFNTYARYAACAFIELIQRNNMYASQLQNEASHTQCQKDLINSQGDVAFLIDGSYAYSEMLINNAFSNYISLTGNTNRASDEIRWYSLPNVIEGKNVGPVAEGESARKTTLIDEEGACFVINGNEKFVRDNPDVIAATKDFLQFLVSNDQLVKSFKTNYVAMAYKYTMSEADYNSMPKFGQVIWDIHETSSDVIIKQTSDSKNLLYLQSWKQMSTSCHRNQQVYFYPLSEGGVAGNIYAHLRKYISTDGKNHQETMQKIYLHGTISESVWQSYLVKDV